MSPNPQMIILKICYRFRKVFSQFGCVFWDRIYLRSFWPFPVLKLSSKMDRQSSSQIYFSRFTNKSLVLISCDLIPTVRIVLSIVKRKLEDLGFSEFHLTSMLLLVNLGNLGLAPKGVWVSMFDDDLNMSLFGDDLKMIF